MVVKAFLEDGVVELKELPENRKNKGITFTEKGQRLCAEVILPLLQQEEQSMAEIGEAEAKALMRLIELYGKSYCKHIAQIV